MGKIMACYFRLRARNVTNSECLWFRLQIKSLICYTGHSLREIQIGLTDSVHAFVCTMSAGYKKGKITKCTETAGFTWDLMTEGIR